VLDLLRHEDFRRSVPTPDHFLPMLYLAGLAADAGEPLTALVDGCVYGSISMASYTLGLAVDEQPVDGATAGELPSAPPDDANI
jgi:4,5-DOPA dioxygenase extradiol